MALIPIQIPPGVLGNGTGLAKSGRWEDASLVRWQNGVMRPVKGWRQRVPTTLTGVPSGMICWRDNAYDPRIVVGSNTKLQAIDGLNAVTDITPASFVTGSSAGTENLGYGGGLYGGGTYGTPRSSTGTYVAADTWSMDTWGQDWVGCYTADTRVLAWSPGDPAALVVPNAPSAKAVVVSEERFLFALGAGGESRRVDWSDREDRETWAPSATNEAGSFTLQTVGYLQAGIRVRGQLLLLTSTDAHAATYLGPPFVYGFERVGTTCGLVAPRAVAPGRDGAVWMGKGGFFYYAGGAVERLACEVEGTVFGDLNQSQISLVHAFANEEFSEVWWFYPSGSSTVCDKYVVWDYAENVWMIGSFGRAAAFDRSVFRYPIMASEAGIVYDHEVGYDYDGAMPYAQSGPIQLGNGDQVMCAQYLYPDERTQGDVTVTFLSRFYPNGDESEHGPYTPANPTPVRFTGREVRMRVDGAVLSDWRIGIMRLDVVPGGLR